MISELLVENLIKKEAIDSEKARYTTIVTNY